MINSLDIETITFAYTKLTEYVLLMLGLVGLSILCVILITKSIAILGLSRQTAPFLTLTNSDVKISMDTKMQYHRPVIT